MAIIEARGLARTFRSGQRGFSIISDWRAC